MGIKKEKLRIALAQIQEDKSGCFLSNSFLDLGFPLPNIAERINKPMFFKSIQYIHNDVWNIETIIKKLSWMRDLWSKEQIDNIQWFLFASSDIKYFHVEFRSIFDYLAKAIKEVAEFPNQVPESFNDLRKWVPNPNNAGKLDSDIVRIVQSCMWFDEMKDIRDIIVHRGAETMTFLIKYKITFQVHQGLENKISIPEIMHNPFVVDFELYAGLYLGYLFSYLEEISEPFYRLLDLEEIKGKSRSLHPGLKIVRDWIERVS
jgi:hypothetical protein